MQKDYKWHAFHQAQALEGGFITTKVYKHAKALVLTKLKKQFKDVFMVMNNYVLELKEQDPRSNVNVISEKIDK